MGKSIRYFKIPTDISLEGLAKKYRMPIKEFWDRPENKEIRKKRSDPKDKQGKQPVQLKKGDVVYKPLTKKEEVLLKKNLSVYKGMALNEKVFQGRLMRSVSVFEYNIHHLKQHVTAMNKVADDQIKVINECRRGMKSVKTKVDTVQTVLDVSKGLKNIAKAGFKASKLTGAELAKANKELLAEVTAKIADVPKDAVKKLITSSSQKTGVLAAVKMSLEIIDNTTSVSYWSLTAAALLDGKSWSEASTYDIDEEMNKNISELNQLRDKLVREIKAEIAKQSNLIVQMKKELVVSKNRTLGAESGYKKTLVLLAP